MKNTVFIKLYRNDWENDDWHDINLDEFAKKIAELHEYGKTIGKNVYFTACQALNCTEYDCFAEVIYNSELSDDEKHTYTDAVKFFARDADYTKDYLKEYTLPCPIAFIKTEIELV